MMNRFTRRIGIDCRVLGETMPTGVAKYTYNLVKNILELDSSGNEYVLFFHENFSRFDQFTGRYKKVIVGPKRIPFLDSHWLMAKKMDGEKLDLIHFPAGGVPLLLKTRFLVTVHDLGVMAHPEWFDEPGLGKILPYLAWGRARHLIAVSAFTKSELISRMSVPEQKITVIHEGVDQNLASDSSAMSLPTTEYFIFVGSIEPRKNISSLLQAFSRLLQDFPGLKMVIVGKEGWKCADIVKKIKDSPNVLWARYVDDSKRNTLIKNAVALVYPSFYEGFGLPVLEAMSLGVPVIASDIEVLREVARDSALFVNPDRVEDMAAAMKQLYGDIALRQDLIKKGRSQAARFTWRKTAEQTLNVYRTAIGGID